LRHLRCSQSAAVAKHTPQRHILRITWSQAIDHTLHITLIVRECGAAGMMTTGALGVAGMATDGTIVPGLGAAGTTGMDGVTRMDGTMAAALGSVGTKMLPPPLGTIRSNVFVTPRIWFERSVEMPKSWARAPTRGRARIASQLVPEPLERTQPRRGVTDRPHRRLRIGPLRHPRRVAGF
jgi:hypothetical protein